MTKNTAEFKTADDYVNRAFYILSILKKDLDIKLVDGKLLVTINNKCTQLLASELLDIYKEGWDERSVAL